MQIPPGADGNPPQNVPQLGYPQRRPSYPQQQAQNGYPQPGQTGSGYPMPGQPQPGQPQSGYPMPGYPQPGYLQPGYPQPGQPHYGYPGPGHPGPGHPGPGNAGRPGQPAPSSPPPGRTRGTNKAVLFVLLPALLLVVVLVAIAGVTAVGAGAAAQRASGRYDTAVRDQKTAVSAAASAAVGLATAEAAAETVSAGIEDVVAAAPAAYVPAESTTDIAAIQDSIELITDTDSPTAPTPSAATSTKPTDTDALDAATDTINRDTAAVTSATTTIEERTLGLNTAVAGLSDAATTLTDGVTARSAEIVSANPSLTHRSRLDLDTAVADVSAVTELEDLPAALNDYVTAAKAVESAHAARQATTSDPYYATRVEVENYASSLALGVDIDFSWAQEVNGFGTTPGSYGGLSWGLDEDGLGKIQLSDSVAYLWQSQNFGVKGLVAHEVGHTVAGLPQCWPLFTGPSFNRDNEMWATAWAFSHGFEGGGSGDVLYGRPTADQVAVAAKCR